MRSLLASGGCHDHDDDSTRRGSVARPPFSRPEAREREGRRERGPTTPAKREWMGPGRTSGGEGRKEGRRRRMPSRQTGGEQGWKEDQRRKEGGRRVPPAPPQQEQQEENDKHNNYEQHKEHTEDRARTVAHAPALLRWPIWWLVGCCCPSSYAAAATCPAKTRSAGPVM